MSIRLLGTCVSLTLGAAALVAVPRDAAACSARRFCAQWRNGATDGGYGNQIDDGTTLPARGARVTILRPYPEPALDVYLSEDQVGDLGPGCIEFDSQFSAGHKVVVHSEAMISMTPTTGILVRGFANHADYMAGAESIWIVHVPPIPAGMMVDVDLDDDDGDGADENDARHGSVATIMGISTAVLQRLQGMPGSLLVGTHKLDIHIEDGAQNAFADQDGNGIQLGSAGGLDKRFILAHEMGHWIQFQLTTDPDWQLSYDYGPNHTEPPDDPFQPNGQPALGNPWNDECRFAVAGDAVNSSSNPNRHGIRSAEFSSGAMVEGFGHFVASVAFNDPDEDGDGTFKYYKDVDEDKLTAYAEFEDPTHPGVVSLAGGTVDTLGGNSRWTELMCSAGALEENDWDHPLVSDGEEVSTELDWLRLFWQFQHGVSGLEEPPGFWDVVHLVTYTQEDHMWSETVMWPQMDAAIDAPGSGFSDDQRDWFRDLSAAAPGGNGVFHESP